LTTKQKENTVENSNSRIKISDGTTTLRGQLGTDPELRVVGSDGQFKVQMRLAKNNGYMDRRTNQYTTLESAWYTVTAWRKLAENIAESLEKGVAVIAVGELYQRTYTVPDTGEVRTVIEFELEDIGPSLRNQTTKVTRNPREEGAPAMSGAAAMPSQPMPAQPMPEQAPAPVAATQAQEFTPSPWG
jgi:single-strand DNA-binding protein